MSGKRNGKVVPEMEPKDKPGKIMGKVIPMVEPKIHVAESGYTSLEQKSKSGKVRGFSTRYRVVALKYKYYDSSICRIFGQCTFGFETFLRPEDVAFETIRSDSVADAHKRVY